MSLGDTIMGTGNTMDLIAAAMRGQQGAPPSPQGAQGAPSGPQGAPGPQGAAGGPPQPQPPSQATSSPPDLQQLYLRLAQQNRSANEFDRGLAGLQAAFAPPGQQAAWLGSAPPPMDAGGMVENLMKIQQAQYLRQNQQTLMNAAPALAAQLFGANPTPQQIQTAQGIIASGKYGDIETNLVGGADLDQRQYQAAVRNGTFQGTYTDWRNQGAASGKQMGDYATEKANAITTFPDLDKAYGTAEATIERLNANPAATIAAVHLGAIPDRLIQLGVASGKIDQATANARSDLNQLGSENFRSGLTDVKNVRSQSEANKISGSVTMVDTPQNSDQKITDELGRLEDIAQAARGNLTAAAGKQVPAKYNGLVDSSYLDPKSPVYNGASQLAPTPLPDDSLASSVQLLKAQPQKRDALIRHFRTLGYDTSKL
jgi:hypothetical protein